MGRLEATNAMEHPCYIVLATKMKLWANGVAEDVASNLPLFPYFWYCHPYFPKQYMQLFLYLHIIHYQKHTRYSV